MEDNRDLEPDDREALEPEDDIDRWIARLAHMDLSQWQPFLVIDPVNDRPSAS